MSLPGVRPARQSSVKDPSLAGPLPWVIAWRFLRGRQSKLLDGTARAALLSTALVVMAMIIAMALMTGYREDLQNKLVRGNAAVIAYPVGGAVGGQSGALTPARQRALLAIPGVRRRRLRAGIAGERHGGAGAGGGPARRRSGGRPAHGHSRAAPADAGRHPLRRAGQGPRRPAGREARRHPPPGRPRLRRGAAALPLSERADLGDLQHRLRRVRPQLGGPPPPPRRRPRGGGGG